MRLFTAIAMPGPALDWLVSLQAGLPGGHPVPEEALHLTLDFHGECDRHAAEELDLALSEIRADPVPLAFDGLGMFRERRRASLHARVVPDPRLTALREAVRRAARAAGVESPRRRFVPHVTLARFGAGDDEGGAQSGPDRWPEAWPELDRWIAARAGRRAGPWIVPEFGIWLSELGRGGPVYTGLADYPLSG